MQNLAAVSHTVFAHECHKNARDSEVPQGPQASCERRTKCAERATYEVTDPEIEP